MQLATILLQIRCHGCRLSLYSSVPKGAASEWHLGTVVTLGTFVLTIVLKITDGKGRKTNKPPHHIHLYQGREGWVTPALLASRTYPKSTLTEK